MVFIIFVVFGGLMYYELNVIEDFAYNDTVLKESILKQYFLQGSG